MKRKYLYTNILDTGFELFGDIKFEDDEESEDFDKIIDNDLNDIDRLIKEIDVLGYGNLDEERNGNSDEERNGDFDEERNGNEYELGDVSIGISESYNNTIQLAFIGGLVFVTNMFIYLHYSQEYSKWEETNQKYLLTWLD